jgi:seryl-tRNA synthetase
VNWAKAWKAAAKTRVALRDFDQLWAAYQDATKLMFKALDKVSAVEDLADERDALRERVKELEAELTRAAADLRHLTHNGNNLDHLIGRLERLTTPGAKP